MCVFHYLKDHLEYIWEQLGLQSKTKQNKLSMVTLEVFSFNVAITIVSLFCKIMGHAITPGIYSLHFKSIYPS